jgi:hypothetical protein
MVLTSQLVLASELERVSYHAAIRFVERILLVTPDGVDPALPSSTQAEIYCAAAGTTVAKVRSTILTPAVLMACKMGVPHISNAMLQARIQPDRGVITTIYEPRVQIPRGRQRSDPSKHEIGKHIRRSARKRKSRPSIHAFEDDGDQP